MYDLEIETERGEGCDKTGGVRKTRAEGGGFI